MKHHGQCARCVELAAEVADLQQTFDLQWEADMRAVRQWREAHPGNDLVLPDRANMVVWLLERLDAALAATPAVGGEREALIHALVRFQCLADHFKEVGEEALWAMSEVNGDRMQKALGGHGQFHHVTQDEKDMCPTCAAAPAVGGEREALRAAMHINAKDREYADALLNDLDDDFPTNTEIVAQWFRKVRYETLCVAQPASPLRGRDRDLIALDAAHQIEALPNDLHKAQKTARIQLIVLDAMASCDCGVMCQDLGKEAGCRYMQAEPHPPEQPAAAPVTGREI